nr:flavodoxin [Lachnospiraceae bacterium]
MKTLIVYYSLEGNTAYIADKLAARLNADTLRLVPKKAYKNKGLSKFLWGGKSALMAEQPELEPYEADPAAYEQIIFGFPVWASRLTPPLRTFISENQRALKAVTHISAFACQSGMGGEKALQNLADCLGIPALENKAIFIDPLKHEKEANEAKFEDFCKMLEFEC